MKKIIVVLLITSSLYAAYNPVEQLDSIYGDMMPASKHKKIRDPENDSAALDSREYYESLIYKAAKPRWALPVSVYFNAQDEGFNCEGCSSQLSTVVFGKCPITFRDIYLFSKLSDDNK